MFGAAVLLLGGRRGDRWGHLLGVATPIAAFVVALLQFIALLGRDADNRTISQHLYTWIPAGPSRSTSAFSSTSSRCCFVLLITFVGRR